MNNTALHQAYLDFKHALEAASDTEQAEHILEQAAEVLPRSLMRRLEEYWRMIR